MSKLIIANCFTSEFSGDVELLPVDRLAAAGSSSTLSYWFARDGDVLVLPDVVHEAFLDYVTGLTGVDRASLTIVVPPPGVCGTSILTADRFEDDDFLLALGETIRRRSIRRVFSLTPDVLVGVLAQRLGLSESVPGNGFLAQGGNRFVSSKSGFRALASGAGLTISDGAVVTNRRDAQACVVRILDANRPVILKQDFGTGGMGNEIVCPAALPRPSGARETRVLRGRREVGEYLDEHWGWLSGGGRFPVTIEEYHPGCRSVFAEFEVGEEGPLFEECGEMFYSPIADSQAIPAPALTSSAMAELVDGGLRVSRTLHSMGYRGVVSVDAVVAAEGPVIFTELNARVTGSTPLYTIVGREVVGPGFGTDRLIVERVGWEVPSFEDAIAQLDRRGLLYSAKSRRGVVVVKDFNADGGVIQYCVVAESVEAADEDARRVETIYTSHHDLSPIEAG